MTDVNTLIQFLWEGDIFGFLQAIFVSAFQSSDIFYSVVALLFTIPLYIRTRSLTFMAVLWILIGGFFMVALPLSSSVSILLMIMGIAGLLFKLFSKVRG